MNTSPYTIFGREYPRRYDAIVIGAGIAGLFCANILAKGGMKVLLLERHYMLGGFCSTFRRKGFIFDAATHFYPLLGNPTTLTGKLCKDLGDRDRMGADGSGRTSSICPVCRRSRCPAELGPYIDRLKQWFPDEAANIDKYFLELRQAYMYGLLVLLQGRLERPGGAAGKSTQCSTS